MSPYAYLPTLRRLHQGPSPCATALRELDRQVRKGQQDAAGVCVLSLSPLFPGNLPWKPPSLEGRSYVYGARARSLARSPLPSPYTPQLPLLRRTTSRSSIVCRTALTCSLRLTASTSQLCLPRTGACSPSTLPLLLPWGFTPAASGGEFYFIYRFTFHANFC